MDLMSSTVNETKVSVCDSRYDRIELRKLGLHRSLDLLCS